VRRSRRLFAVIESWLIAVGVLAMVVSAGALIRPEVCVLSNESNPALAARTEDSQHSRHPSVQIRSVPRALTFSPAFKHVIEPARLGAILRNLVPRSQKQTIGIGTASHALRLWGRHADFDRVGVNSSANPSSERQFPSSELIGLLLNNNQFRLMYPESAPLLSRTEHGIAIRVAAFSAASGVPELEVDAQPHIDKVLSVAGEIGIPAAYEVLADDRSGAISDVVSDALHLVYLAQEIEFTTKALLLYLELPAQWTVRDGSVISTDDLLMRLVKHRIDARPCFGTHRCLVLAMAAQIDRGVPFLGESVRKAVAVAIRDASLMLEGSQHFDGSWGTDWTAGTATGDDEGHATELLASAVVTGHHLEWIAVAPDDLRPSALSVERAIVWLQSALSVQPPQFYLEHYGPLTHAARALVILSGSDAFDLAFQKSRK